VEPMGLSNTVTIDVRHGGRHYAIELRRTQLPLNDGSALTHFEVPGATTGYGPVYQLGREVFLERAEEGMRTGKITEEIRQQIVALASANGLPERGRRIDKAVTPRIDRTPVPTALSKAADKAALEYARKFQAGYRLHKAGEYDGLPDMTPGEFLLFALEVEVSTQVRELAYRSLATPAENRARRDARSVLASANATEEEREAAQAQLSSLDRKLDERYKRYYEERNSTCLASPSQAGVCLSHPCSVEKFVAGTK